MITRLRISNFQTHRKIDVRLKRVTTIVGASDAGKSAVLRAIRWAMLNKPGGASFVRDGAKVASVSLRVDKHTVTRSRGVASSYDLDDNHFKAFGTTVPEEIANLLNVTDLNFQTQHDAPFWFALTPGQVSRELNAVVDLSVMDTAMAAAAKETTRCKSTAELIRLRLLEARESVACYAWAPTIERQLAAIERETTDLAANRLQTASLASAVTNGNRHQTTAANAARARQTGLVSIQTGQTALDLAESVETLATLVDEGRTAEGTAARPIPSLTGVELAADRARSLAAEIRSMLDLLQEHDDLTEQLGACSVELEKAETELATQLQGVCPICQQPIPSPSSSPTSTCPTSHR